MIIQSTSCGQFPGYWDSLHPFSNGILDSCNQMADIVTHGFGGDTSGSRLEIDVAGPANASIEGVGARHQGRHVATEG